MIDNVTNTAAAATAHPRLVNRHTPFGDIAVPEQSGGDQYDFSLIFGAAANSRTIKPEVETPVANTVSPSTLASTLATANAAASTATAAAVAAPAISPAAVTATLPPAAAQTVTPSAGTGTKPGVQALVSAIMNGSFQPTYVTDPNQLKEVTPWMTDTMPNFYYASDETANQLAQLLGGSVVKMPAFGQNVGWQEPNANFIQLPSGQTVRAADLAYYARCGVEGPSQLLADLTQTINVGSAWNTYYQKGGAMPDFSMGYVGPPIAGMDYPSGMIGSDGNVVNPAMRAAATT